MNYQIKFISINFKGLWKQGGDEKVGIILKYLVGFEELLSIRKRLPFNRFGFDPRPTVYKFIFKWAFQPLSVIYASYYTKLQG